jgi:DNA-directed RNA polymerase subunit N (RpoN/RPB10)
MKLDRDGYAIIPSKATSVRAHRARWVEAGNSKAKVLDHLCRNRWCCNPEHLESVTPAENVRRGDCAKLGAAEVTQMRTLYRDGASQSALAKEFGLSQSHVSRVVRGLYWSDGACKHWQQRKGGTQNL